MTHDDDVLSPEDQLIARAQVERIVELMEEYELHKRDPGHKCWPVLNYLSTKTEERLVYYLLDPNILMNDVFVLMWAAYQFAKEGGTLIEPVCKAVHEELN